MALEYYEHQYSNSIAFVKHIKTGQTSTLFADEFTEEEWESIINRYKNSEEFKIGIE